jgi:LAO/AO transport system kinase
VSLTEVDELAEGLRAGDRRALARAITLVESTRTDHRVTAGQLLDRVLPATGGALRVGITGTPGAGKSTLLETLGQLVLDHGHRAAVLAVDPSSRRSGGSILGDKTRMEQLSRDPRAFIRPSPSGGTLGGVARRTREAMLLCEAAGFDVVFVETVGVGQSEVAVAGMVDCFVLVASPGGGDELQGIKRGIMELADLVVGNKCDGDLRPAAERAVADYRHALHLLRPKVEGWGVPVIGTSALEGHGVEDAWAEVGRFSHHLRAVGAAEALRSDQAVRWLWDELTEELLALFRSDPDVADRVAALEENVRQGVRAPTSAARDLLSGRPWRA